MNLTVEERMQADQTAPAEKPTILVVDDNKGVLDFLLLLNGDEFANTGIMSAPPGKPHAASP